MMEEWPLLLKIQGDTELTVVEDASECTALLQQLGAMSGACFVDKAARVYKAQQVGTHMTLIPEGTILTDVELNDWLHAHAHAIGQCCIAKLRVSHVDELIAFVSDH